MLRPLRYTVKMIFALMAIAAIAIMLFFWRVSNGPVLLDGYSPALRSILQQQNIGNDISFESSILTWRSADDNPTGNSSFEVRFQNIEIKDPETSLELNIPQAGMQLSIAALFRGVFAPTFIEFSGLDLNLLIPKEAWSGEEFDQAAFIAAMRAYLDEFNNSPNLIPRLTKQILSKPMPGNSTGYLQQFSLANTAINITDELSGDIWNIPDAILDIKRVDNGLNLLLEGEIDIENEADIPLHLSTLYDISNEVASTEIRFSNLTPTHIAGKVDGLSSLSTLNIPVGGLINFSLDKEFELPIFDFEFDVGAGRINPGEVYDAPIKIDEAGISGQYFALEDTVSIEYFHLEFDGAVLDAHGMINDLRNNLDIAITAEIANLPMINLKTYWPSRIIAGARARSWIASNVTGGLITEGQIKLDIRPEMLELEILPDEGFVFTFNIENGSSHYLKPMPQVTELTGKATLNANHFKLEIDEALIDDARVENAVLNFIDTANRERSTAHFEIPINGKVEEILRIIDIEPLGYPSKYGISEDSITGEAEAHLTLDFPLIRLLKLVDIDFEVQADVQELQIPKLSDDLALSHGTMALSVDGEGILANGNILLNGVDFNAEWSEDFTNTSTYPTRYIIDGIIENEEWENLHLPFEPYVAGPTDANLTLFGVGAGLKTGSGRFDLKDSEITFEPLGWNKEEGEIAEAIYTLDFVENGSINVNDIVFGSDKLNSALQFQFDGEIVTQLFLKEITMADADFSALFEWDADKSLYQTSIKGRKFNAIPLMDIILNPEEDAEESELPNFDLAGSMSDVTMYNDVNMGDITILAKYVDDEIIDFGYNGNWQDDRNLSIIIASGGSESRDQRKLTLQTNDAGQALRGLDFFTSGDQGDLLIEANMMKKEKGYSFNGTIKAEKFNIANSKAFSELLKEKEFAKAQQELEENGLSFESFESDFIQYDDVLTISSGSAKGPTLGVTVDGFVDQKYDDISLGGTIIPAYGINSLLSNIPLLGTILAGGKGEGVFAATYNMVGSVEDPDVNINPLMALAPGIFRKIFGALGSGGNDAPTAREEAQQTEEEQAVVNTVDQSIPPD